MKRKCSVCGKYSDGRCDCVYKPPENWCGTCDYALPNCACPTPLPKLKTEQRSVEELKAGIAEYERLMCKPLEGTKHDAGKPDLSILPKEALDAISAAFSFGEAKYGRYNYYKGMDWHRLVSAALRHITAFNAGEDNDTESGLPHLAHAGACISMLLVYTKNNLGKDTRRKP